LKYELYNNHLRSRVNELDVLLWHLVYCIAVPPKHK